MESRLDGLRLRCFTADITFLRLHRVAVSPAPLSEACAWGGRGLDIHALRRRDHWSMLPRDA